MTVSARDMMIAARKGGYGIGAFNINNLEWTQSVLKGAQEANAPIIVQTSMGAAKYMGGYKLVVDMVNDLIDSMGITVPIALHLDHGNYEAAKTCIDAGFSSIMFDGSSLPFDENLEKTRELAQICKDRGISLEAEVGAIGGEEDGVVGMGECADPDECKAIADCGVDMLACGIGNIHGVYPEGWPGLRFDVLDAIIDKVGEDLPLVLHGGSGIPDAMVQEAVRKGVSKINVNTELQLVFAAKTREYIEAGKDKEGKGFDPRKLLAPGFAACVDMVKYKIDVFGSTNKA